MSSLQRVWLISLSRKAQKVRALALVLGTLMAGAASFVGPARADEVSAAASAARTVQAFADAAAAQIPVARAGLNATQTATDQTLAAMRPGVDAANDADQAKAKAQASQKVAEGDASLAAKALQEAESAARVGDCAAAKAAALAAGRASEEADAEADKAAANLGSVKSDAAKADQAKTAAMAAAHRAHLASNATADAFAAADKAAASASDAEAAAFGKSPTHADIGKRTSDGAVAVSDANYRYFQDAVAAAQSANSSASTVNQIRQNALNSYNLAHDYAQNALNAVNHIRTDAGAVIDAENAARRAARKAADAGVAAKKVAEACKPRAEAPKPPEGPPPTPKPKLELRTYPSYTHRQTHCPACSEEARALNAAVDAYNSLSPGPNGTANSVKDSELAKVKGLSDALNACETRCASATPKSFISTPTVLNVKPVEKETPPPRVTPKAGLVDAGASRAGFTELKGLTKETDPTEYRSGAEAAKAPPKLDRSGAEAAKAPPKLDCSPAHRKALTPDQQKKCAALTVGN